MDFLGLAAVGVKVNMTTGKKRETFWSFETISCNSYVLTYVNKML